MPSDHSVKELTYIMEEPCIRLIEQLERHQRRRSQGIPTVTTLVGPVTRSTRLLRRWCSRRQSDLSLIRGDKSWFGEWMSALWISGQVTEAAFRFIANTTSETPLAVEERLLRLTKSEMLRWLRSCGLDVEGEQADALACRIIEQICKKTSTGDDPPDGLTNVAGLPAMSQRVRQLSALFGDQPLPAVGVHGDVTASSGGREATLLLVHELVQLSMAAPNWTIALIVSPSDWLALSSALADGFTKAAIVESVIQVANDDFSSRRLTNTSLGPPAAQVQPSKVAIELTDRLGKLVTPTANLITAFEEAIRHVPPKADVAAKQSAETDVEPSASQRENDSPFRSRAEEFLFLLLEQHSATRRLFEPAGDPGFRFGPRNAEIDLMCRTLKLAIEVDGYYHFQDPDCYRRDRRKDCLMQRHGYFVLRFLAEDVVQCAERVLADVISAVRFRRGDEAE